MADRSNDVEAHALISIIAPLVSIGGAAMSWYWAQKRFRWDAGKELAAFRTETLNLLQSAILTTNDTWRRRPFKDYRDTRDAWERTFRDSEPLLGVMARVELQRLRRGFDYFEEQFLGAPIGGLHFAELRAADEHVYNERPLSDDVIPREEQVDLFSFLKKITDDPQFMTR